MNQIHLGSKSREIGCLFTSGITPTHHDQGLVAKHGKSPITGCAIRHALVLKFGFIFETQVTVTCSSGNDQGTRIERLSIDLELRCLSAEITCIHRTKLNFGPKSLGLLLEVLH